MLYESCLPFHDFHLLLTLKLRGVGNNSLLKGLKKRNSRKYTKAMCNSFSKIGMRIHCLKMRKTRESEEEKFNCQMNENHKQTHLTCEVDFEWL